MPKTGLLFRGIRAEVVMETWEDDPRYVRVSLNVEPNTPGLHTETYIGYVKSPVEETFVTKTGKVLTDADIEKLADEAEAGYDVSHLLAPQDEQGAS